MATVQQIYIAIFGRPADPVGLAYWNEQTNNGADLSAMIAAFTAAPEYEARFEGQSNEEIISSIYQSLFGREPDDEGLEFYAEALANGELPIETIAVRILDGAQNEDQTSIENKTEAADKFTASIDTPEEIEAYQGTQAATEAQEFLETVNDDPESVPSDEEVDQAVKEVNEGDYDPDDGEEEPGTPGGPGGDGNGVVRALTSDNDTISTGSGDDIINASAKNSLNSGDTINGGSGNNVLNIETGGLEDNAAPTISGVDLIVNSDPSDFAASRTDKTLDLEKVSGVKTIVTDFSGLGGEGSSTNQGYAHYDNASSGTVFGIAGVSSQIGSGADYSVYKAGLNIDLDGLALNLLLDANTEGSYYSAVTDGALTTLDIEALSTNEGTIAVNSDVETINIRGAGNLAIQDQSYDNLKTFNAVDASGSISLGNVNATTASSTSLSLADDFTITGGTGNDVFDLSTVSVNGSVDGGDGDDVISGGTGDDVISGGTGSNTIILGGVFTRVGSGEDVTFQAATAADLAADSDHSETFVLKQQSDAELDGGGTKPEFGDDYPDEDYGGDTVNIALSESFDTTVYGFTLGAAEPGKQADTVAFSGADATSEFTADDLGVVSITLSSNETPYTDVFLEGEAREIFTFNIGIDTDGDDTADSTLTLVDVIGSTSKSMKTDVDNLGTDYSHLVGIEDLATKITDLDHPDDDFTLATLFSKASGIQYQLNDGGFEELLNFVGSNFTVDGAEYI